MIGLGDLLGGTFESVAWGISGDGSTVVGYGNSASGKEAFRFTGVTMSGLGDLPGGIFSSEARAVSQAGDIIVGQSNSANGNEAFVWTQTGGMQSLVSLLFTVGINPAADGWSTLSDAVGVSANGRYVAGTGTRNGFAEAFLVDLGAAEVPEASTWAALAVVSLAGLWQARRRYRV
jgi:probable HAF family extracellular repeat protein